MYLIPDWQRAVKRFWSFRFALLASVLSGCEVVVQMSQPDVPSGLFAGCAGVVSLAAGVARIVAQPKAYRD